jgi:hypothetical protein
MCAQKVSYREPITVAISPSFIPAYAASMKLVSRGDPLEATTLIYFSFTRLRYAWGAP